MIKKTTHKEQLHALNRVAGQIKGIQNMVEEEKYCVDIVIQLHAAVNALYRISEQVLTKHIEWCVREAFSQGSKVAKAKKIEELARVVKLLHSTC
jgi:CsoR family transcriptional regulator, copper-sensing transcriptional repressor